MANTEDLKSSEETPLAGSSPASGISELMRAHECLLNTLGASKSLWIRQVHKNASDYYKTWKSKYIGITYNDLDRNPNQTLNGRIK